VSAIFDIVGEEGALHPCVGRPSVEVQLDELRRSANTDLCKVQGVMFDVLGLMLRLVVVHIDVGALRSL
jgi:hypothetical protein